MPSLNISLDSFISYSLRRNLKLTLELANVVADSRYNLYEDFVHEDRGRSGKYLGAIRQAILAGLEGGGSDPFRIFSVHQN
jgi:nuclear pore complex protein Nup107